MMGFRVESGRREFTSSGSNLSKGRCSGRFYHCNCEVQFDHPLPRIECDDRIDARRELVVSSVGPRVARVGARPVASYADVLGEGLKRAELIVVLGIGDTGQGAWSRVAQ